MKENPLRTAIYLRLSKEDGSNGESGSIAGQRKLLYAYARKNGFSVEGEYVDDGVSGTTFQREGWQRLLRDVESGQFDVVMTKDLSRLGRNYIMTGQYTELYFPQKGVRFIAVNDGYDSAMQETDMIPFRNVLNEMYARDISRKIRTALRVKMEEGAYIGHFAPFGYAKDPKDKNHLVIAEEPAAVVREIFRRAAEGQMPSLIAAELNGRQILPPKAYREKQQGKESVARLWNSSMICKMLKNQVYLGHTVQGKSGKVSFKAEGVRQNPPEEWIVVPHTHTPLIAEEVFEKAQRRRVPRRKRVPTEHLDFLLGLVFCGACGEKMTPHSGREGALVCSGYKKGGRKICTAHKIDSRLLFRCIEADLAEVLSLSEGDGINCTRKITGREAMLASIEKRQREWEKKTARLYEDWGKGLVDESLFQTLRDTWREEGRQLVSERQEAEKGVQNLPKEWIRFLVTRVEIGETIHEMIEGESQSVQKIRITYGFFDDIGE